MDLCGYFSDPGIFLLPAQIKKGILEAEKLHEMKWHENAPVFIVKNIYLLIVLLGITEQGQNAISENIMQ